MELLTRRMNNENPAVVVFANVPPPDHGQSRMVAAMLRALEGHARVVHVNARFSKSTEDIGNYHLAKLLRIFGYIGRAIAGRFRDGAHTLYYIPGPVKWSAVVRDWIVLGCLRPFFPYLVFHWHAIGQGEWSAGSDRVRLLGPTWMDRIARCVSRRVLDCPDLSIAVGPISINDARALRSLNTEIVCNGIVDPCPEFDEKILPLRAKRINEPTEYDRPLRIVFLSRGSLDKGVMDALEVLGSAAKLGVKMQATFAGGLDADVKQQFLTRMKELECVGLDIKLVGFLNEAGKAACFASHDLLLSTSHWESFGLTVVEALAWGMPVVASVSDGICGVLPKDYPYLEKVGDISALCESVIQCGNDIKEGKGLKLSIQLRNHYLENFTIHRYERAIQDVFSIRISKITIGT